MTFVSDVIRRFAIPPISSACYRISASQDRRTVGLLVFGGDGGICPRALHALQRGQCPSEGLHLREKRQEEDMAQGEWMVDG